MRRSLVGGINRGAYTGRLARFTTGGEGPECNGLLLIPVAQKFVKTIPPKRFHVILESKYRKMIALKKIALQRKKFMRVKGRIDSC